MSTQTETPKAKLSVATKQLFYVAAQSHTLAEIFGVELVNGDNDQPVLRYHSIPRPWLSAHPRDPLYLTFEADKFAARLGKCSDGQQHMMLFILNVWNPSYAESKGWHFDLFKAMAALDENNLEAIAWWMQHPIWP